MKSIITSIIVAIIFIGGAIIFTRNNFSQTNTMSLKNVSMVDGKQIIEIVAQGGYQPRTSIAKAGVPTIIRFNTSGTFDCSSSVRIPSLDISKNLPQTGTTDVDVGVQPEGRLRGSCGMGMYPFEVDFGK